MVTKQIDSVTAKELWADLTDGHIPCLLEIYNPDIKWGDNKELGQDDMYLRVINDSNAVKYRGKKYVPCAFSFKPPAEDGTKIGSASATISNLDASTQQLLASIKVVSDVKIIAMFAKPKTEDGKERYIFREISAWTFQMETANANPTTATFNIIPDSVYQLNVPRDTMDRNQLNSMVEE